MDNIKTYDDLKDSIEALEHKQSQEVSIIKSDISMAMESFKPVNLIKCIYQNLLKTAKLNNGIAATTIGLLTGYISKKVFVGTSHSPLKKIAGTLVMVGITHIATKHPEKVKVAGRAVFQFFRKLIGAKPEKLDTHLD